MKFPGGVPIPSTDLPDSLQDRKNDAYKWTLHMAKRYRLADGIMVNTFDVLGPRATSSLQEREAGEPRVYPVGPLVNMEASKTRKEVESNCLTWLDGQSLGSV